ncbi:MAG: hypothetical protein HY512_00225 [Candidatus Aenigmarchaeota archaeon]|nr:hypothetical protein [Candidatus Aenigmarchaeota archaeon]
MCLQSSVHNLYKEICSFRNLEFAFKKARKGKRNKKSVQDFEFDLERNLLQLKHELETVTYKPRSLKQFVIRDPKTRLISASDFRDRVVYHALCNIIQPIFEKTFIYDSHANQIRKGSSKAIERFDVFKRKVTENGRLVNKPLDNNMVIGYVLKADIKHFFDTVDHQVLMMCIKRKIKDEKVIELIQKILDNHTTETGKGMPIGNLTSQFFANLYLNELDYFVKHELKAKFYIRYVDDFVLLDRSKEELERTKIQINKFLKTISLELHTEKSQIYPLRAGTKFLGFRIFYYHKLLTKRNIRKMEYRLTEFEKLSKEGKASRDDIQRSLVSWFGYAKQANTYKMRQPFLKIIKTF